MTSHTTHPLTAAWLRDLELLLHGIDPGERAEVLAGVHEHLDGSLPPGASDDDVRRVLADLGSPQSVADEAYAGRPGLAPTQGGSSPTRPAAMTRPWVPVTVGILLGLCLVWMAGVVGATVSYTTSSSGSVQVSSTGEEIGPVETMVSYDAHVLEGVVLGLATSSLLWITAMALVLFSPLWSLRRQVLLCLVAPVGALLLSALPAAGWALFRQEFGISVGGWTSLVLVVGGGGLLVFRLCRSALATASRPVGAA